MEPSKKVHKVAYSLFSLVVVILVGVVLYQQHLLKSLIRTAEPVFLEHTLAKNNIEKPAVEYREAGDIKNPPPVVMKEVNELEYQLNAAEEELVIARDQLSDEINKQSDMKELQKMMSQTPQAKNQLRAIMKKNLDTYYGPMFAKLGISGEELEVFKNLIIDYQMAQQDFFTKMQGSNLTEDQRMEIGQDIQAINDEYQNKIVELYGEEAKSQYLANRDREGELQFTSEFSEYLSGTDKMTDEQLEKLANSMAEARKAFIASKMLEGPPISEDPEKQQERNRNINIGIMEAYVESADTILSPSQLEQFEFLINKRIQQFTEFSGL